MEMKICQSCGMPMNEEQYGTNEDGTRNEAYCSYCYQDGKFTSECTLEEMVDFCAPFEVEGGRCRTVEEAREALMAWFPTLDRWKCE
ncbi:MAG: zinc ribbon domain-containing protein [Lachnospiraceae bacterium]|nr:zinc ribbon domain-containing protein [Lachnospiraceae bacterium]